MRYLDIFKMPKATTIMARTSSITNSFVNGIIPCITPSDEEIKKTLDILGMEKDNIRCAYCGDKSTEWDHFRPLVKNKKPTGYITEINNLVPACGKCNQSKGNKNWKEWILSDAKLSPKTRRVPNIELLIKRLEIFEKQSNPIKIDFEAIVGEELWQEHWNNCVKLHDQMKECQKLSDKIRALIKDSLNEQNLEKETTCAMIDVETNFAKNKNGFFSSFKNKFIPQTEKQKNSFTISQQPKIEIKTIIQDSDNYIDSLKQRKVGIIAQRDFKNLLESNIVPEYIVEQLQNEEYCKNLFDINFPVLLKVNLRIDISTQRKDHLGRDRYYATPLIINSKKYLLTSQWYDRNKYKLIKFIQNYQAI